MSGLKLNRFSKRPERFILEEYSNCEVPAGCGGIVLRWARPGEPVHVELTHFTAGTSQVFVDGERPQTSRFRLPLGHHVLAIEILQAPKARGLLLATLTVRLRRVLTPPVVTSPDGTWKFQTTRPPPSGWREPDFDDATWLSLQEGPLPSPAAKYDHYLIDSLTEAGATALVVPPAAQSFSWFRKSDVWIRRRFHVDDRGIS